MATTKYWTSQALDTLKPFVQITVLGLFFWAASIQAAPLERCEQMESQNQLLYQQFKASKSCKESDLATGWTDCAFKAGQTEILLVGAIGIDTPGRMAGILGSGFWIRAVDPADNLRVFLHETLGLLVKVDAKSNLQDTGCIHNEAYITLDARVLDPGEFNRLTSPPPEAPKSPAEQAKQQIKTVQEALLRLGYKLGPPDGVLGPATRAALTNYKRDKGLRADMPDEKLFGLLALEGIMQSLEGATKTLEQRKP